MSIEKKRVLASEALRLTRIRLNEKLSYLSASWAVPGHRWTDGCSGTDGVDMYWNMDEVLKLYAQATERLQRVYLHQVLHGMYLHPFRGGGHPKDIWNLACDLMTEYRIDRLAVPGFERPIPVSRSRWYRRIREDGAAFREDSLCGWLKSQNEDVRKELKEIFCRDGHELWNGCRISDQGMPKTECIRPERLQQMSEAVHRWRTVFEQLELHREEHKRQAGGSAGAGIQQIILEKEQGYDYRRYLKRFAVEQEELSLDLDSFDYIAYDYSRKQYENLVLLEPLEYRDMQKLREFVIAIDTSGSCSGEVVRQFLEETWEILSEKDNFFRKMNLHMIQCDCMVQEHVRITSEEEWKDYLEHIEVKGHGDTDFTPVFRLVDQMVRDRELKNLKGLLYFTDGDGIYPAVKPEYETAFVFLNERLRKGKTPGWAWSLTLDREWEDGR